MNPFFYNEEAGPKGLPPLFPCTPIPADPPPLYLQKLLTHSHPEGSCPNPSRAPLMTPIIPDARAEPFTLSFTTIPYIVRPRG